MWRRRDPGTATTAAPVAAVSYTLVQEPQAGYQPIYDFISSATKTLDMTMYSLSDPKADAARWWPTQSEEWQSGSCSTRTLPAGAARQAIKLPTTT